MITEMKQALSPSKVYIPLTDTNYKIANVKVKVNDSVLKGQVLAYKFQGKKKLPVVATVSGTVLEFKELTDRYGKVVDHCVIENDRNNKQVELKKYDNATASQVRTALEVVGLEEVNVDGIYTPLNFENNIEHLFVNAVFVNEPHYTVNYEHLRANKDRIASGIALVAKAALTEDITIFVDKTMPKDILEEFGVACVDKNVNFVTVDPRKVNGADIKFINKTLKSTIGSDLLQAGGMYIDVQAAMLVHDTVVEGLVPSQVMVALSGDGIKSNAIVEVTSGTLLSDLVEVVEGYNEVDEMVCHIGDFLTGRQITDDEVAVTLTVNAVNFSEFDETEEDICIKCGDCNDACPVGILPQNIMDAELRSVNDRIVELNTHECTECGLCSYVCPSKINVLEWVRRARRRVG